ncbi:hypothetical protein MPL1032_180034 [Mesorhizobium plurifarium]|uniref:Uncharacterized protein n=1 Tax=Mesorhizobium plurifarium TaxID=69974 RepID=A0A0K2VTG7_MESPL|nr:hypothetical protein MPL1032_180034 [Mesorhizobium plurifarium]
MHGCTGSAAKACGLTAIRTMNAAATWATLICTFVIMFSPRIDSRRLRRLCVRDGFLITRQYRRSARDHCICRANQKNIGRRYDSLPTHSRLGTKTVVFQPILSYFAQTDQWSEAGESYPRPLGEEQRKNEALAYEAVATLVLRSELLPSLTSMSYMESLGCQSAWSRSQISPLSLIRCMVVSIM